MITKTKEEYEMDMSLDALFLSFIVLVLVNIFYEGDKRKEEDNL